MSETHSQGGRVSRRQFTTALSVVGAAVLGLGAGVPYVFSADEEKKQWPRTKADRLRIGAIGVRYQGTVIAKQALQFGDVVAIADVDRGIAEKGRADLGGKADLYEDYRKLLDRKDIDVVTIGTPDHWHTKILIDACRAGKDVYCEKPMTLTVDEGKRIRAVVAKTGRVVQIGSWQRSDDRFRRAVEMVRQGRIGRLQRVEIVLNKNVTGGPFAKSDPPAGFNWNLWQGQTPAVRYIKERTHYTFRWWYEYSGGQMTDWGAHHVDIGQWAIGALPESVDGRANFPHVQDGYNVAVDFSAHYTYPGGVQLSVSDTGRNGVMFIGENGRLFVDRGRISGAAVDRLKDDPLPREKFKLYAHDNLARPPKMGKLDAISNHMGNFYDCILSRKAPISDVESQHRSVTTCHLGNISMRLGRPLKWNAVEERFVGDEEANAMLQRKQRAGFEIA